jgi:hypothetical protein
MDVAYLSAISALAGSLIGGVTTGASTWLSQRTQARASQIAHEVARREDLIRDFIMAASKTYGDALVNNDPQMQEIVNLYALVARMRVLAMPESVAAADRLLRATIDTYFEPNRTVSDLHEALKSGAGVDPLGEFSEAARKELGALVAFF